MSAPANHADLTPPATSAWEVFRIFLVLGLTSFGGPVAHMGYYRNEFVEKRRWLDEHAFADLMALCQFLPGPASSQVATAIGHRRAGFAGAIAALAAFTLPSAIALVLFAQSLATINASIGTAWLHGLKIVAVAVVAQALWGMGRMLCPDRPRATIAIGAAVVALSRPSRRRGWWRSRCFPPPPRCHRPRRAPASRGAPAPCSSRSSGHCWWGCRSPPP